MSLRKRSPKVNPNPIFVKINASFSVEKKNPKIRATRLDLGICSGVIRCKNDE
jgi:hypothetical protein